jgi:hypothetical protein
MDEVRRKQLIGAVMPKTQNERKGKGKRCKLYGQHIVILLSKLTEADKPAGRRVARN